MTKITIISDFYLPHWTGISKSIAYMAESIKKDFSITMLTVQFHKKLPLEENKDCLTVLRYPPLFTLSRAKFSLTLIIDFFKRIRQTDVVLINSPSIHILPVSLISKIFKKKLLIFHQGDLILPKGIINYFIEKVFDLATLISFASAKQLATYTSDYAKNSRLLSKFPNKTKEFIPPLPYFISKKIDRKKDFVLNNQLLKLKKQKKFLIGFAGRFVEEKGFDILLEAAVKFSQKNKNFILVFAGETNIVYEKTFIKKQYLINQLKNNLLFLGLLNDDRLQTFYEMIDLFVLPSRSECFGLVQAEAMAQKTPVLVADIPGARDPIKKTSFGLLFTANSSDDLIKKINKMSNELSSFNQKFNKVSKYFNYENSRKNFIEFIKS